MTQEKPWWELPLPTWVLTTLTHEQIKEIRSMNNKELAAFHNYLTAQGFGNQKHNALIYVAQRESWKRHFQVASVKASRA